MTGKTYSGCAAGGRAGGCGQRCRGTLLHAAWKNTPRGVPSDRPGRAAFFATRRWRQASTDALPDWVMGEGHKASCNGNDEFRRRQSRYEAVGVLLRVAWTEKVDP